MAEHVYNPKLKTRPVPQHPTEPAGRIHLDVVVTDQSGHPDPNLSLQDFSLLDNNNPRTILSFESIDAGKARPDPPVEVILLVDQLNATFQQISFGRSEIARFLSRDHGHLAVPISIALLTHAGLQMQKRPSVDGTALLSILGPIKSDAATVDQRLGGFSTFDKFLLSVQQLDRLAGVESKKPGRKLLIWMGPGWRTRYNSAFKGRDRQLLFNTIVQVTNRLREARVAVYNVSSDNPITNVDGVGFNDGGDDLSAIATILNYQSFLKPVRYPEHAVPPNLDLKVFAIHTGGRILGPDNDLVRQIDECIQDASTFYRIAFDPPRAEHLDEYHELKIQLRQRGLTVRTYYGYYSEVSGN